jgi:molecular chaperone DnaJ
MLFGCMATDRDYNTILGVERSATEAEIKKAFRRLAQKWHPDVNTDAEAQERFKEINEAYQILSDPQQRQRYDLFGKAGVGAGADGGFEAGFAGFGDIFDAFFGGGTGSARRGRPVAGSDLRYDLRITFQEAVKGTEKEIEFPVLARCDTCQGTGAKPGTTPVTCP